MATSSSARSSIMPKRDNAAQIGAGDVVLDVVNEVETEGLAVLRGIGDAVPDGLVTLDVSTFLPCMKTSPVIFCPYERPEQAHGEFGASRSHEAGNADDFARRRF